MKNIGFITLIFILAIGSLFSQTSQELDYNIVATGAGYGVQGSQYIIELQMRDHTTEIVAELGSGQMRITYNSDAMTLNIGASSLNSDIVNYGGGYSYDIDRLYSPATGKIQAGIAYTGGANPVNAYDIPTCSWLNFAHVVFDITDPSQTSQIAWIETTPETQFYAEDNVTSHTNNIFTGNDDVPLPVYLSSMTIAFSNGLPTVNWVTHSESNNVGWNVYRSVSINLGQALIINLNTIPGNGTTTEPSYYSYIDEYEVQENYTYWYWLESISNSGETEIFGPISIVIPSNGHEIPEIPMRTALHKNFPNPFNPNTLISFDIEESETGVLSIYNVKGQLIVNEEFEAGKHNYSWDARAQSSGVYFYNLQVGRISMIKKMVLVK